DANDYGIVFYDRLKNHGAYKSVSFGKTDEQTNSYGFTINVNIPSGKTISSELFTGNGLIRSYIMPTNLTGFYYLVLAGDITDKFVESDENNNLFYTTDQEPKLFENGMGERINMMGDNFRNVFTKSQMQTNGAKRYQTSVTPKHRNAYTPDEIIGFLKKEARNGNLARKISTARQNGPQPGKIQSK
ncbi:MAG TPA: hypothetical protein PK509_16180, partial [Catalimonadaceae bacterium]|nr:hypothetical protein [Catalimonadaceae bacterium]